MNCPSCGQPVTVSPFPVCADCGASLESGVFQMLEGEKRINLCKPCYKKAMAKCARKAKK